jgi:hypothetical protein
MNENRLSRAVFNHKSCRLRGAANAARTRNRMASEQEEEEEQVSVPRPHPPPSLFSL